MDNKSLVCVTQSYAASVLRSTSGLVHFLIGREPDPDNSEIAQLISRSIQSEQQQHHQQQQQQHQQLQQQQLMNHCENSLAMDDCVGNENDYNLNPNEHVFEPMNHHHLSENTTNGNLSHIHNGNNHCEDKNIYSSTTKSPQSPPMETNIIPAVAGTATATNATESHSSSSSSYMQQQYLQSLRDIDVLKRHNIELQLKYSSLTDDICKMKQKSDAKIYELQKQLEDEMVSAKEKEAQIVNLEKELDQKNNLFNEFKQQYNLLEKKYLKVKKLLKESQLRENELLEKDTYFREMADKEKQEMTALINSLKEKIALLELKLSENVLVNTMKDSKTEYLPGGDLANDKKDQSTDKSFVNVVKQIEPVSLLDVSISKQKAELVTRGSLANRQPPSLFMIRKNSSAEEYNEPLDSDSGEESTIPLRSLPVKLDESFSPNVSSASSPLRSQAKILSQAAAAAAIMTRTNSNLQNERKIKTSTNNNSNNNGSYQPAISFASHQQCIESPLSFHDNYNLPGSGDNSQAELTMPNIRYMSALSSPVRATNELQASNISSSSGSLISPVDTSNEEMLNYNELSRNNHSDDSHHQSTNFHISDSLLSCQQNSLSSSINTFTSTTNNNLIITDWSVLDVVEFLNQMNLSTYAKRFQDENITGARFIQLDSAQLKVGFSFINLRMF